ncbi:MAG: hypothetical protein O3A95_04440 [Planctomycetota bacterium]|nr:hypothetical protein [Planctomycetota bacterium]MDA1113533.1 hypothetical protein [Planctomycetota bacterium]
MVWLLASALLTFSLQTPQRPIAVTQEGVQIQATHAEIGDREIQTPFGTLRNVMDPVVAIIDGEKQVLELRKLHHTGALDDASWLRDLSRAGQLEELARASLEVLALEPQAILPYRLLESWGRRIDPVPPKVLVQDRVAWLWRESNRKDFAAAILAGAKLAEEVSASSYEDNDRKVGLSELRKSLRSSSPVLRRVAAHVAGRQKEFSLRETLLEASLGDPTEAARDAAAKGAHMLHPYSARAYWVRNLMQGKDDLRMASAFNLANYGDADGLHGLMTALSAWEHPLGHTYDFAGRSLRVVSGSDRNALDIPGYSPDQEDVNLKDLSPNHALLDFHDIVQVKRYGEDQRDILLEALDLWAGKTTERTHGEWMKFYLEEWLPTQS